VMGRSTGYCKGKSGSLHISAKSLGVVLTSTIVGGELSLAPGVALAQSMLRRPGIVACFFGDGAACEGVFHESLNLAAVWQLPLLYVCENNQWQAYVPRKETMLIERISERGKGYGMESATVDGNDVEAVHHAADEAVKFIRATGKPYLLETYTYRLRGHYEPDDQAYVDQEELARWREKDPVAVLRQRLQERGVLSAPEIAAMQTRCDSAIEQAVAFAQGSPFPAAVELTTNVYA
jgi:acetoin:2,6-dichlorophenolindophenol oxidoreductase subunit alpha